MNQSKKRRKGSKSKTKSRKPISPKIWVPIVAVLIILLFAGIIIDSLYEQPIMTVDDDKLYMEDLNYYFYNVELAYNSSSELFGPSYLDMVVNENTGLRVRDMARQEAVDGALSNEIMYRDAKAKGYTITDEEEETIKTDVDDLFENVFTENEISKNNFTKESLTEVLTRVTLAERYQRDLIESFDIDRGEIRKSFDPEEYREYTVEHFFISTKTKDDEGELSPLGDAEKEEAKERILSLTADAKDTEDWSTLLPEDEEEVVYYKISFMESDTMFDDNFKAIMMDMENGEVSDLYEGENGYYLVRMVDNNLMDYYEQTVEEAISAEEEQAFYDYYIANIEPNHTYKVNQDLLLSMKIGDLTLDR